MAYVLGYFAADGSMLENKRGAHFIEFYSTDKELIQLVKAAIQSNHKISKRVQGGKWKTAYRLQIGSKEIFSDLEQIGFTQNKSLSMTLPDIPIKYRAHFVRGYFDGDGCVYFKKHWASDRQKMRWVFTSRFTSGSRVFLEKLLYILREEGIKGGFITTKNRGFELVLSHRDGLALSNFLYNNVPEGLYLRRKRSIFKKAIKVLWGRSSAWQSAALSLPRSRVQIPSFPPPLALASYGGQGPPKSFSSR